MSFAQLFAQKDLPVSWSAPQADDSYRRGAAKAAFRQRGILLAHIFDAARSIEGDDEVPCRLRYVRTMNPVNVAPWPGHRRTKQRITRAPADFELSGGPDLSSEKLVQQILAGWMTSIVSEVDSEASGVWLRSVGASVTPCMRDWERIAGEVQVEISPKQPGAATEQAAARRKTAKQGSPLGAFPAGDFDSLEGLVDALAQWLESLESLAVPKQIGASAKVELRFGQMEHVRLPVTDRHGHVLGHEDVDLAAFDGLYTLKHDSTTEAARALVERYRDTRDDDWSLFDAGLTKTTFSLKFANGDKTARRSSSIGTTPTSSPNTSRPSIARNRASAEWWTARFRPRC